MAVFVGNLKFEFSGADNCDESIDILATVIVKCLRPSGWRYNGVSLFFNSFCYPGDNKILEEDCNVGYIKSIIKLYLQSSLYKTSIKNNGFIACNGEVHGGWLAKYCSEDDDYDGILISPYQCFYSK